MEQGGGRRPAVVQKLLHPIRVLRTRRNYSDTRSREFYIIIAVNKVVAPCIGIIIVRIIIFASKAHVIVVEIVQQTDDDESHCPWNGTIYPVNNNDVSSGIHSVGRELSNGTTCRFKLVYRIKVGTSNELDVKYSSCTG